MPKLQLKRNMIQLYHDTTNFSLRQVFRYADGTALTNPVSLCLRPGIHRKLTKNVANFKLDNKLCVVYT